jgi:hypothetical protein
MFKCLWKRVYGLWRTETSLKLFAPSTCLSAQGANILHKRSSLKEQVLQSDTNHTNLTSPRSQNMTFDFDSVETPSVTLEHCVSPLKSNRKWKVWDGKVQVQVKKKWKWKPVFKKQHISERISRNVTSSGSSYLHSLPPHLMIELIDESVDTFHPKGQEQVSHNNRFTVKVKTRSSYRSSSPNFCGNRSSCKRFQEF